MKNLIKIILSIFLLSFASQNASATTLKPVILLENVRDTSDLKKKEAIEPKRERLDIAAFVMKGSLALGGVFLFWGILESATPCPPTPNSYGCLNGLGHLLLGAAFIFLGALLALFRGIVFLASKKKNKSNLQKNMQK